MPDTQQLPEPTYETDWVEAADPKSDKVLLWEWHAQHPGGECFLAPGSVRLVALTPEVALAIRMGKLKLADPPDEVFDETPWIGKPKIMPIPHPPKVQATAARHRSPYADAAR